VESESDVAVESEYDHVVVEPQRDVGVAVDETEDLYVENDDDYEPHDYDSTDDECELLALQVIPQ
jgi:hypothetical protein